MNQIQACGAPFQLKAEAGAQAERTFIMIKPDGVQVNDTCTHQTYSRRFTRLFFIERTCWRDREKIRAEGLQAGRHQVTYPFSNNVLKPVTFFRMMRPGEAHLREHYADLAARPFFPGLVRWKLM